MLCELGRTMSGLASEKLIGPVLTRGRAAFSAARYKRFLADRSGNISMIFIMTLLPMVAFVGMMTDFSRSYSVKAQLSTAIDAAALMGGRTFDSTGNLGASTEAAQAYFAKVLPKNISASLTSVKADAKGNVTMAAKSSMKTIFLGAVGIPTLEVRSQVTSLAIDTPGKDLEVALVMDVTGSMSQNNKLVNAKLAAKALLNTLLPDSGVGARSVRVSIVPFSEYVNAGSYASAATGVSATQSSTYAGSQQQTTCNFQQATCTNWDGYDAGGHDTNGYDKHGYNGSGRDSNGRDKNGFDQNGRDANGLDHYGYNRNHQYMVASNSGGGDDNGCDDHWNRCDGDNGGGDNNNNNNNNNNNGGANNAQADGENFNQAGFDQHGFDHDGYDHNGRDHEGYDHDGYDQNGHDHHGCDHDGYDASGHDREGYDHDGYNQAGFDKNGCDRTGHDKFGNLSPVGINPHQAGQTCAAYAANPCTTHNVAVTLTRTTYLTSCMAERMSSTGHAYDDASPAASPFHAFTTTNSANTNCTAPAVAVTPLSNDKQALNTAIDAMTAAGGTAGHLGTAWGWYTISPNWASFWPTASAPKPASDGLMKVAIIMTDGGYNTHYDSSYTQVYEDNSMTPAAANGRSRDQALSICANMKAAGIEVFTMGVELGSDATAQSTLQSCASSTDKAFAQHFYNVANNQDATSGLVPTFQNIATQIAAATGTGNQRLRITK